MKGDIVVLKSTKGAWAITTTLPNNKPLIHKFEQKKNGDGFMYDGAFFCEVPTTVTYIDAFGKELPYHENYAQFLLDNYNKKDRYGEVPPESLHLEVLETRKAPMVETEMVKTAPISKRKMKEKKDE